MIETTPPTQITEIVVPEGVRLARAAFSSRLPGTACRPQDAREVHLLPQREARGDFKNLRRAHQGDQSARLPPNESLMFKVTPGEDVTERAIENEEELP